MQAYCLSCFEPLDEGRTACSKGHRHVPAEASLYWNRNQGWVVAERLLKVLVICAAILATLWLRVADGGLFLMTHSIWLLLLPWVAAYGLWRSAGKLTRHDESFRPRLLGWLTSAGLLLWGLILRGNVRPGATHWMAAGATLFGFTWTVTALGQHWKHRLTGGALEEGVPPPLGRRHRNLAFLGLRRRLGQRGLPRTRPLLAVDRPGTRKVGPLHGHCLTCFAPLGQDDMTCPHRHPVRAGEHRIYWNLHPRLVALERRLKLLILVIGVLGPVGVLMVLPGGSPGSKSGWVFLLPSMGAYGLWRSASKITRHEYNFHPRVMWSAASALLAIFGTVLMAGGRPEGMACVMVGGTGAFGVWAACDEAERWKRGLIEGGNPTAAKRHERMARRSGARTPPRDRET